MFVGVACIANRRYSVIVMNQDAPPPGKPGPKAAPITDPRKARLAAALRDNLKRRKQQDRARKSAGNSPKVPGTDEEAR
jgi:hypothetical protein